jgi:diguanylate cyclase (GGDEF)-like protein
MERCPPVVRPELLAALRATGGDTAARVERALTLLAEELGMPPVRSDRDAATLHTVAAYVAELTTGAAAPPAHPGATGLDLPTVAAVVSSVEGLEGLTRPLLRLLHEVTGLESTYLTLIDWAGDQQRIAYSANAGGRVEIPEGLTIPWPDTLCRRSLEAGRAYTPDVPAVWGDSEAARDLGIVTYVSVPVTDTDNGVVGTLCGASGRSVGLDPGHLQTMALFARLVGDQMNRERALAAQRARSVDLEARTRELAELAAHDPLTGLLNRSGIHRWLRNVLPELKRDVEQLALAFIDVDRFKQVNDTLGHAAGDEVLRELAGALDRTCRSGDLRGRLGGDEFVVAAVLPATDAAYGGWAARLQRTAVVEYDGIRVTASVGAVSIGDPTLGVDDVLGLADGAMYQVKRAARAAMAGSSLA